MTDENKNPNRPALVDIKMSRGIKITNGEVRGNMDVVHAQNVQDLSIVGITKYGPGTIVTGERITDLILDDYKIDAEIPASLSEALASDVRNGNREGFFQKASKHFGPERLAALGDLWDRLRTIGGF